MTRQFKIFFYAVAILVVSLNSGIMRAQNVAINTTGAAPVSSAILDISSTTQGILIPRMTKAEMLAISSPATSLLVYSTTDNCFYFYTGTAWQTLHCTCLGAPVMTLSGATTICQGSSQTYTATLTSGSPATTYVWTFPTGTVITSGQGTSSVTVTIGGNSGTITLSAANTCGSGGGSLVITVTPLLSSPTPITGSTALQVCATGNSYSVPLVAGALSYTWAIHPTVAGTICTSGQGTNAISVDFGSTAATYTISVYDSDACGISSPATTLTVTTTVHHGTLTETTPGAYAWAVPCGITQVTITMYGASGGRGYYTSTIGTQGKGAKVVATYTVSNGSILYLEVGADGTPATSASHAGSGGASGQGDENGGNGYGSTTTTWGAGGGGGSASSIRLNGTALTNRVFVAAGGGGVGREDNAKENGGNGGNVGANGAGTPAAEQGLAGSAVSGGAAVLYSPGSCSPVGITGTAGALGAGGNGGMTTAGTANTTCHYGGGGGGGGGYYGGSGGCAGGGGGGSSYTDPSATSVTITNGNHTGNGGISIAY
jgi:hypothetical protein